MPEYTKHDHGVFCWIDQQTTDQDGARAFYSSLFGWDAREEPIGEGATYTMFQLKGRSVAALGPQPEEMKAAGMPVVWNSYINVDDVDVIAKTAAASGGTVVAEPFDVLDAGRMCVVADPTGAVVSFWQAKTSIGAEITREPGSLSWNELATRDVEGAKKFYADLLGWTYEEVPTGPDSTYTIAKSGDHQVGGILLMGDQWGDAPPHWDAYFEVEDCDATAAKAKELGAEIHMEPLDMPGAGRFAFLKDPYGAFFYVIKPPSEGDLATTGS